MTIGLVGYSCNTGLGELNRQVVKYIPEITKWLVKPHKTYGHQPPEREIDWKAFSGPAPMGFFEGIDTVLFFETEFYKGLTQTAKSKGKRVVCVPMLEWTPKNPSNHSWLKNVDLFICPTAQCYDTLRKEGLPCVYFPWPCDTQRFRFSKVRYCHQFLFIEGNGGYLGRKGADTVKKAKEIWPEMPLIVKSFNEEDSWPEGTQFIKAGTDNLNLYSAGDVLIYPAKCDGIGLQPYESMVSGIPVILPSHEPWSTLPALRRLEVRVSSKVIGKNRDMPWCDSSAEDLVNQCKELLGKNIAAESKASRMWAEGRSWSTRASSFTNLVQSGVPE